MPGKIRGTETPCPTFDLAQSRCASRVSADLRTVPATSDRLGQTLIKVSAAAGLVDLDDTKSPQTKDKQTRSVLLQSV